MTGNFKRVFGDGKPVIGMVHLGALPGSPLYDRKRGLAELVSAAAKDLAALQAAGADFVREIFTGSYASDMGPWTPNPGPATGRP